jgi:hypothetical protein
VSSRLRASCRIYHIVYIMACQVAHVVVCLSDPVEAVRDLAQLFFVKLAERSNNPVHNLLGDIIGTLARDRHAAPAATPPSSSSSSSSGGEGAAVVAAAKPKVPPSL